MRIAHICISCFYVDNMGYQENILPKKHFQQGHCVEIITTTSSFNTSGENITRAVGRYKNENGIQVVVLPYNRKLKKYSAYLHLVTGLYDELDSFSPDIVFCHGLSFLSIFELERYCRKHKVELFADNHSDYYNTPTDHGKYRVINGVFWPIVAHSCAKYCKKAWGTTPARCDYLIHTYRFPKEKVGLLVMGGDEDYIHTEQAEVYRHEIEVVNEIPPNAFLICSGGKLNHEKRIIELMKAVERIDGAYLLVFGAVMSDLTEQFSLALKQSTKTRYVGWASQLEIYRYFIASDLVAFPGTHSVLWEQAVASGTPTAFMRRRMMEHVNIGGNCCFFEEDSEESIYQVLKKVVLDKELYQRMKTIAFSEARIAFSYSYIAKKAIGVVEDETYAD